MSFCQAAAARELADVWKMHWWAGLGAHSPPEPADTSADHQNNSQTSTCRAGNVIMGAMFFSLIYMLVRNKGLLVLVVFAGVLSRVGCARAAAAAGNLWRPASAQA